MKSIFVALLAIACATPHAYAQTRVIDGDTLEVDGTRYRLYGIDAPEMLQRCGPSQTPVGIAAKGYLMNILMHAGENAKVVCEDKGRDKYGRTIGLCEVNGVDIQEEMVRAGFAFAYPRYSNAYIAAEQEAIEHNNQSDVHGLQCQKPWDWREEHKR